MKNIKKLIVALVLLLGVFVRPVQAEDDKVFTDPIPSDLQYVNGHGYFHYALENEEIDLYHILEDTISDFIDIYFVSNYEKDTKIFFFIPSEEYTKYIGFASAGHPDALDLWSESTSVYKEVSASLSLYSVWSDTGKKNYVSILLNPFDNKRILYASINGETVYDVIYEIDKVDAPFFEYLSEYNK